MAVGRPHQVGEAGKLFDQLRWRRALVRVVGPDLAGTPVAVDVPTVQLRYRRSGLNRSGPSKALHPKLRFRPASRPAVAGASLISSQVPCPTSAIHRSPVSESKLNEYGFRNPRAQIRGSAPPNPMAGLSGGIEYGASALERGSIRRILPAVRSRGPDVPCRSPPTRRRTTGTGSRRGRRAVGHRGELGNRDAPPAPRSRGRSTRTGRRRRRPGGRVGCTPNGESPRPSSGTSAEQPMTPSDPTTTSAGRPTERRHAGTTSASMPLRPSAEMYRLPSSARTSCVMRSTVPI